MKIKEKNGRPMDQEKIRRININKKATPIRYIAFCIPSFDCFYTSLFRTFFIDARIRDDLSPNFTVEAFYET